MKALALSLALLFSTTRLAAKTYETPILAEWEQFVTCKSPEESAFLPQNIYSFLESENHLCLAFYPAKCGLEDLVEGPFVDVLEFKEAAEAAGFKITHLERRGQMLYFDTPEELSDFLEDRFGTPLSEPIDSEGPFFIPTKIIFVELIRQ